MELRRKELSELQFYLKTVDKDLTMLLQNLQWDRKTLLKNPDLVTCKYDPNHRVPPDKKDTHEEVCVAASQGYSSTSNMLPDPVDNRVSTLVKLNNNDIRQIINAASSLDPLFKKVAMIPILMDLCPFKNFSDDPQPLTLEQLQEQYTADERRAIHDAVVAAAPFPQNLGDMPLQSGEEAKAERAKSHLQVLAELRDMKRRRAKYRVAAKTRNYSDVLRDVINSQMEFYAEAQPNMDKTENKTKEQPHSHINRDSRLEKTNEHKEVCRDGGRHHRQNDRDRSSVSVRDTYKYGHGANQKQYRYNETDVKKERHQERYRQRSSHSGDKSNRNIDCVKEIKQEKPDHYEDHTTLTRDEKHTSSSRYDKVKERKYESKRNGSDDHTRSRHSDRRQRESRCYEDTSKRYYESVKIKVEKKDDYEIERKRHKKHRSKDKYRDD